MQASVAKVFCFFFSKKKAFLALLSPQPETLGIAKRQASRVRQHRLSHGHGALQLVRAGVLDGWTRNHFVPRLAHGQVQADAHEAMVQPDRPVMQGGGRRQLPARQVQPSSHQCRPILRR